MRKRYYLHKSLGFIKDYFGEIGPKVYVPYRKYRLYRMLGYRGGVSTPRQIDIPCGIGNGEHN